MTNMPRRATRIVDDLNEAFATLISAGLVDDQAFLGARSLRGGAWEIRRSGVQLNATLKNRPYLEIYNRIIEESAYDLLLLDGAIVQFAYEGIGETLQRHRLAYLPSPNLEPFQNDPELYLREYHFLEVVGHQVVPVPIRFDYDAREGVAQDIVHPVSHMTLGQYKNCRIPVTRAVHPTEFLRFIVDSFYFSPEMSEIEFKNYSVEFSECISVNEQSKPHVRLP